jgi:nicotinamidase-related amidase
MLGVLLLWTTAQADPITLHTRWRTGSTNLSAATAHDGTVTWEASRTAVVVCDMWDQHHCPDATERVGEMAPAMNEVLLAARAKGMLILHCPSDTLKFYQDHPGRKLAQAAPPVKTAIPLQGWCSRMDDREAPLPIDDSDGGCDGCPECPGYGAWTRQHPALEIRDGDAITDSAEAFYLMRQRGITNVIVMGVHINMCVLGRPFAIRQMVQQGQNVVLMRDMTDSMYNHRKAPYVSHFRGTELVVEHIERFWCPSITRADFTGKPPFRFAGDVPKKIVLLIGENEYQTWETLPAFAAAELSGRGYQVSTVMASPREGDPDFTDIDRLRDADLVVVSTRRRTPPQRLIDLLKAHVAAGKPVVALRTASHGFDAIPKGPGYVAWPTFDVDVLGMKYGGHYNNKPPQSPRTLIEGIGSQTGHIVMTGVTTARQVTTSHLYKQSQPCKAAWKDKPPWSPWPG